MPVRLAVFDIAGTTVKDNHDVSKALSSALSLYGYHVPVAEIDPIMGYEKTLAIRQLLQNHEPTADKITDRLVKDIHKEFVQQMILHYRTSPDIVPLPKVEETFTALKEQGVQVGLDTGFSKDIADIIISRLQWREKGLIDYVVGSDEVEQGRPYPYMIEKMMIEGGIGSADEVVKIGDTAVDMQEGHNANCKYIIGVTTGIYTRHELETYNPTHIIDDISDVLTIINQ